MKSLGVSVGILAKNLNSDLIRCIHSISPPSNLAFEILIVNHRSSDDALGIVEYPNEPKTIFLFTDRENNLGKSRNFILKTAKFSYVAFIDSDCVAPKNWLNTLIQPLLDQSNYNNNIIGVGGGNIPPDSGEIFYKSLEVMSKFFLGNGGSTQTKNFDAVTEVTHMPTCNILLNKAEAIEVGGFSDHFSFVCEDLEFSKRVNKAGKKFLYHPNASVIHWHTPSFLLWTLKMFRYGRGQLLVNRQHKNHLFSSRGIPLFAIFFLLGLTAISPSLSLYFLLAYFASMALTGLYFGIKNGPPKLSIGVFGLLCCTHIPYGLGEFFELFYSAREKNNGKVNQ
jgi:GT2 family glycosyltransferase